MGAARGCFVDLTKLHLSMSKSWLTPDYLFFDKMLTLARLLASSALSRLIAFFLREVAKITKSGPKTLEAAFIMQYL